MRDVVFRRSLVDFHKVVALVSAMMGDRQKTGALVRSLMEVMFPGEESKRLDKEAAMAEALVEESGRRYSVQEVSIRDG
jgi:hypothetical protein